MKADEQGNVNRYNLTERQQLILDMIKGDPKIQTEDIEKALEISRSTVQREIQEIKNKKLLHNNKKTASWEVEK